MKEAEAFGIPMSFRNISHAAVKSIQLTQLMMVIEIWCWMRLESVSLETAKLCSVFRVGEETAVESGRSKRRVDKYSTRALLSGGEINDSKATHQQT